MRSPAALILVAALLGGCAGVYANHPPSSAETTRYDARLLGIWRVDEGATPGAGDEPSCGRSILVVGRAKAGQPALRVLLVTLGKDDTIAESAFEVWATTIAEKDYAAVHLASEGASSIVLRYQAIDEDTLRVLSMDERTVADDVRSGAVAGSSSEWKDDATGKPSLAVTLDAPTPALRAYLEKRGDVIYRADRPLVLRRVATR